MFFQKCPKCTTQDMGNTKEQNTSLIPVFQKCTKCTTQDMGNTKENNTSSVQAEDHSVVPSGREQDSGSLQGRQFCWGRNWYYFSKEEETWNESRNLCQNMDSSLVKIDDIQEQNFIQSHIKYTSWIGLYKKEDKNEWRWQDSTKLAQQLTFHQSNKVDEKCGCLNPRYISSADCSRRFRYICEKNKPFYNN
uniref:C-type lectin domain-containing protein n=1 Tax=Oryctolagus cuniculus TaxID=9986 RepID=A0A5F9CFJ0_RABIT